MDPESDDQDRTGSANRRRFVKAIGTLGVVGLAGCGGDDTESPGETGTDGDDTETDTGGTDTPTEPDGEETPTDTDTLDETETETPTQDIPDDPPTVVSLSGGGAVESGGTTTLTATVENPYLFPIQSVEVRLESPDSGWTIEATGETTLGTIETTSSAAVSWEITVPADADAGVTLTGSVSYATNTDSTETEFTQSITVFDPGEVPQDGLEAYYSLDGDTATNAVTGTDAIENGSPTPGAEGIVGDGFSFEPAGTTGPDDPAENDGLQSGENLPLNDAEGTIGAWINVAGHDDYGRLYQVGGAFGTVPDSGWQTRFDQANDTVLIETRDGADTSEIATTPPLDTDTWYYVVTVMQAGEGRIHLFDQDGELSGSPWTGDPAAWATSGSDPLFLMTGGYDEGTNGIMDEVRGYSRALTETEVLELYTGSGGNV
jgi:hypothetical protein